MNDFFLRRLAQAGNTGQDATPDTAISLSVLYGHAHYALYAPNGTRIQNQNILNNASDQARYSTGKTWFNIGVFSGGVIGSSTTTVPSFIVPALTSGDLVDVTIDAGGYIVGAGGNGGAGRGGGNTPPGGPGLPGGTAIQIGYPTTIVNNGIIGGGGGGGGGGNDGGGDAGGGGGGGAGYNRISFFFNNIIGGTGGNGPGDANTGANGTLTNGGQGGDFEPGPGDPGRGGNGGGLGLAGARGGESSPWFGGAGGVAIAGTSFVTFAPFGDVRFVTTP
jgi:hypothetical protein